jgi:hypothetical protein
LQSGLSPLAADSEDDTKRLSQRPEFGNVMSRELLFFDLNPIQLPDGSTAK